MKKPNNVHEFDGYDFPYDPTRTKVLSKEEEDAVIAKVLERTKKRIEEQKAREAQEFLENKAKNAVSISVTTTPNASIMEQSR